VEVAGHKQVGLARCLPPKRLAIARAAKAAVSGPDSALYGRSCQVHWLQRFGCSWCRLAEEFAAIADAQEEGEPVQVGAEGLGGTARRLDLDRL
jgi:hypothetical protein